VRRCLWYGLLLAGGLMGASLSAATAPAAPPADTAPDATATADNQTQNQTPYAPIVERNMFGLVPIPPPAAPVDPATLIPPPKITPNGIMTLFGKLQVLFKVAGVAKPGQPPKDESYVMCEGDRQDDIEVQKIDQTAATITFNNHGVVQALPLVVGGALALPGLRPPGAGLQGDSAFVDVLARVKARAAGVLLTEDFHEISDTFLTLAAIAPLLAGPTRITGIAHTRRQETDRVAGMARELQRLGQHVVETEDALEIHPRPLKAGQVITTYHDHRFAMSFGILGCHDLHRDGRPWLSIQDPACCAKTFPGFFGLLETVRRNSLGI